jgi:A/G-specific adenine glycosylase
VYGLAFGRFLSVFGVVTLNRRKITAIVSKLLDWFSQNARDLPWRRTRDPYAIWVSEIMLQQTQVKTVMPYWERWMRELPTVQAAANASPDKIHKLWEGLGYYTRVRNLQKAARQIVEKHDGKFPDDFDDILALPGIGRYTAGAICSIAFNQPTPILDGNVIRVLTRVFGIAKNPREKKTNAYLWQLAEELVIYVASLPFICRRRRKESHSISLSSQRLLPPSAGYGETSTSSPACSHFNQSLMELGALVCTSRNPRCQICPVKDFCVAFRESRIGELPNPGKRETATARRFVAFVVERNGRFLVRQRPAGIVNAHLWEFPNVEIGARLSEPQHVRLQNIAEKITATDGTRTCCGSGDPRSESVADVAAQLFGSRPTSINHLCTVKHSITRYRITLEAFRVQLGGRSSTTPKKFGTRRARPSETGVWLTLARLRDLAFTAAHKKILTHLKHNGRHLR